MGNKLKNAVMERFLGAESSVSQLAEVEGGEDALVLLQMIQETVIEIGEMIERRVSDSDAVILVLENLAEEIYETSRLERYKDERSRQKLVSQLKKARDMVVSALEGVYEILFLPYKASMWDALESVYLEAADCTDCNVRVMPVPYYHVTEDRTALEKEYEGTMFPDNIPITDYREYHLATELPDVIFIHNPYDDKNSVTSLPEQYFSSELKKYTDHLVYVPYKVCSGKVKEFYCVMPGVKNAWRVFVQSEQVREVYLKYYQPEKIVATGAPKIDKVVRNAVHKPQMPDTWSDAVWGRKVFLLNTHLNQIINQAENMLLALEEIISIFEKRKAGAVIWRPHPLSIETAKAKNPAILQYYQEIIKRFQMLNNAVYDETPDPQLAIALADAYIGDKSSLVTMFGVTGKPVFIREIELLGQSVVSCWEQQNVQKRLEEISVNRRLKSVYYERDISVEAYVDMVLDGVDILAEKRKPEFSRLAWNTQGDAGKQIWECVKSELNAVEENHGQCNYLHL